MAIGALAIPVLKYGFGTMNWRLEHNKNFNRKARKILTRYTNA
jgi:hypothetical protein